MIKKKDLNRASGEAGNDEKKVQAMGSSMQALAVTIDRVLIADAAAGGFRPFGFMLIVTAFDGSETASTMNIDGEAVPQMLRELADTFEKGQTTARAPGGKKVN
jgi:hypothetical protein